MVLQISMKTFDRSNLLLIYRKEDYFHKPKVFAILDQSSNTIIPNEDRLATAAIHHDQFPTDIVEKTPTGTKLSRHGNQHVLIILIRKQNA